MLVCLPQLAEMHLFWLAISVTAPWVLQMLGTP